jgi:hypothetical protein
MKLVTIWSCAPENRNAAVERFKQTEGDKPPDGIRFIGRWFAIAGGKGVHVCEVDDPLVMAQWASRWTDLMSIEIYPAIDDEEARKLYA